MQDAWFCVTCCRTALLAEHNVGAWAVLGAVLRLFFPPANTDGVDFRVAGVHIDGVNVRLKPGAFIKKVFATPPSPKLCFICSCPIICLTGFTVAASAARLWGLEPMSMSQRALLQQAVGSQTRLLCINVELQRERRRQVLLTMRKRIHWQSGWEEEAAGTSPALGNGPL